MAPKLGALVALEQQQLLVRMDQLWAKNGYGQNHKCQITNKGPNMMKANNGLK
jgi:hypothetical protein